MKKILGAAIGTCVHVGGLHHFLKLAESEGYNTQSLGPAVSIERLIRSIQLEYPTIIAISYRLTPETAARLFDELQRALKQSGTESIRMIFGGTAPVAVEARRTDLFERVFDGSETVQEIKAYLRGSAGTAEGNTFADDLIARIEQKYPYPLLRHHFGRPSLEETIDGAKLIAESGVVDVISLGTDQNAQEHFFHPEQMDPSQHGAGGVPVRFPEDLKAIYESSRCGNFPLVRCYAGTQELMRWARMSVETIHNAWGAIPLCWYSVIDGRSKRTLVDAISENQRVMRWYAEQGIPVEVNEAHQWSLRDAHDSLAVTMAFLAAYNAKRMGVRHYVAQYMFNTPPGTSAVMDIAKMLAKKELIEELHDETFISFREVRAGIAHFSPIPAEAQGQLASSVVIQLSLKPHIVHVVGFSEGDHAVYAEELIQSCNIVHGVLRNCLMEFPDLTLDERVTQRKNDLISEARALMEAVKKFGVEQCDDPLSDAKVLAQAIKVGILDAPHFRGNPNLCGKIVTRLLDGAWYAIDETSGVPLDERTRTSSLIDNLLSQP